ncbi:MAG: hypothetical protein M3315_11925 [Actinomycetota bacterium]|nr:hypothetical protein [Actinomycetota bacterium]
MGAKTSVEGTAQRVVAKGHAPVLEQGFKVVRVVLDVLFSVYPSGGQRIYSQSEFTEPYERDGPLAVFTDYVDALQFIMPSDHLDAEYRIYLCQYDESPEQRLWVYQAGRVSYARGQLPRGTAFAKRLRLTKLMYTSPAGGSHA